MYTNQTAEELELMRCTSEGIYRAQNSNWLKFHCIIVYFLFLITSVLSFKAGKLLKNHNVYSHGSQILLAWTLLNANVNQAVYFEIKIRQLVHILIHSDNPCKIEFHSPQCAIDQSIYSFSNVFATELVSALTCDRFIAFMASSFYQKNSKLIANVLLCLCISSSLIVHIYTYGGVSRAGYVPSCQYPPQLSLDTFELVNRATFWFIMANCFVNIIILFLNIHGNKKIKKSVYDTKIRYNSFENLLTTKAICNITSTQFAFLSFSTAAVDVISTIEAGMSEESFHIIAQSFTGLVYANVSIPILILFETNRCIKRRRKSIDKMTNHSNEGDYYIASLRASWEKV